LQGRGVKVDRGFEYGFLERGGFWKTKKQELSRKFQQSAGLGRGSKGIEKEEGGTRGSELDWARKVINDKIRSKTIGIIEKKMKNRGGNAKGGNAELRTARWQEAD